MKTLILILLISGFSVLKNNERVDSRVIAKYVVFDEDISPELTNCSHEVKPFKEMHESDCAFLLENQEFDIESKFILDHAGHLKEYWNFKPMGPLTYNPKQLQADQKLYDLIGGELISIQLSDDQKLIFDSGDTLRIEKIYPEQKLIFVERSPELKRKNKRLIFEVK